jgi:hypothetical protein
MLLFYNPDMINMFKIILNPIPKQDYIKNVLPRQSLNKFFL